MTVSSASTLYREFVADGLGTARSIGYGLRRTSDLIVEADGVVQTEGQHYAITGNSPNQQIEPIAPFWANGATIAYYRFTAREQEYDIPTGQALRNESLEDELDRAQRQQQEQDEEIARAAKAARGEAGPVFPALATLAGKTLMLAGDSTNGYFFAEAPQEGAVAAVLAFAEVQGERSQAVIFSPSGVREGGYPVEFSAQSAIPFVRAYAKVFAGSGTCRVRVHDNQSLLLWEKSGVGSVAVDEVIDVTLPAGRDLVVTVDEIDGDVQGLVAKLEGAVP